MDHSPESRDVDYRQPLKLLLQVDEVVGDMRFAVLRKAEPLRERPAEDGLR